MLATTLAAGTATGAFRAPRPQASLNGRQNDGGSPDFQVERAAVLVLVELRGFEPLTFALRTQRSTN